MKLQVKAKDYNPIQVGLHARFIQPQNKGFTMLADYEKAEKIVKRLLNRGKVIDCVKMGLDGDWDWNSCEIWKDMKFHCYNKHDRSYWAEPIIIVYYKNGTNQAYSCWKKEY